MGSIMLADIVSNDFHLSGAELPISWKGGSWETTLDYCRPDNSFCILADRRVAVCIQDYRKFLVDQEIIVDIDQGKMHHARLYTIQDLTE